MLISDAVALTGMRRRLRCGYRRFAFADGSIGVVGEPRCRLRLVVTRGVENTVRFTRGLPYGLGLGTATPAALPACPRSAA